MNTSQQSIGVRDAPPELWGLDFRREALLFDVVAVPMLGWQVRNLAFQLEHREDDEASAKLSELEWLIDQGIIYEPPVYHKWPSPEYVEHHDKTKVLERKFNEAYGHYWTSKYPQWIDEARTHQLHMCDIYSRFTAAELRECASEEAHPVLYSTRSFGLVPGRKEEVLQIVFENIPQPEPCTLWEDIVAYRSDPDTKYRMAGLHTWIADVARGGLVGNDIRSKLEWELETYQRHMAVHRLASRTGKLEVIVTTGAEVLEDLIRLKFGKAMKTFFSLRKQNLELVSAELGAPGRELAYIDLTQQRFRDDK